ncbi:MAG: hypothetical protein GF307_04755 [candidate division Zixibacteria bacterium]|nr:hypothetical protein [candidate division Zixibacteria bacterium]
MFKWFISAIVIVLLGGSNLYAYQSLQEEYDNASAGAGYDRFIVLDPDIEYEGDLVISNGDYVGIVGGGAKIYAGSHRSLISIHASGLDIWECVLIGGHNALNYRENSYGVIWNNTIYNADSVGIKTYIQRDEPNVEIYNNIISDCFYGIWSNEYFLPTYIGYNIIYETTYLIYAGYCPG